MKGKKKEVQTGQKRAVVAFNEFGQDYDYVVRDVSLLLANIHLIITVLNLPAVTGRQLQDRGLLHREFGPDQETSVKWHDHVYLPRCVSIDTLCGSAVVVRLLNPSSHTWQARSCSAWCRWQSASPS
mgnify:CR=1 FL=1